MLPTSAEDNATYLLRTQLLSACHPPWWPVGLELCNLISSTKRCSERSVDEIRPPTQLQRIGRTMSAASNKLGILGTQFLYSRKWWTKFETALHGFRALSEPHLIKSRG